MYHPYLCAFNLFRNCRVGICCILNHAVIWIWVLTNQVSIISEVHFFGTTRKALDEKLWDHLVFIKCVLLWVHNIHEHSYLMIKRVTVSGICKFVANNPFNVLLDIVLQWTNTYIDKTMVYFTVMTVIHTLSLAISLGVVASGSRASSLTQSSESDP